MSLFFFKVVSTLLDLILKLDGLVWRGICLSWDLFHFSIVGCLGVSYKIGCLQPDKCFKEWISWLTIGNLQPLPIYIFGILPFITISIYFSSLPWSFFLIRFSIRKLNFLSIFYHIIIIHILPSLCDHLLALFYYGTSNVLKKWPSGRLGVCLGEGCSQVESPRA